MVKKSLQFLNTLCSRFKKPPMFLIRHTNEILGSIVAPDAIQMMHYPTGREGSTMGFFPYKNMFSYISLWVCSWMVRLQNKYISCANLAIPSALPLRMLIRFLRSQYSQLPSQLHFTTGTSSGSRTHFFTAIWAVGFTSAFQIIKAFLAHLGAKALPFTLRRELPITLLAVRLSLHTPIIRVICK